MKRNQLEFSDAIVLLCI